MMLITPPTYDSSTLRVESVVTSKVVTGMFPLTDSFALPPSSSYFSPSPATIPRDFISLTITSPGMPPRPIQALDCDS